ncbi:MAG: sporulation protein [Deltaproteobacteria bacterium]|nr:sporulation protein [Deltaproteobacteria bacterium]
MARKSAKKGSPFPWIVIAAGTAAFLLLVFVFIRYGDDIFPPPVPEKTVTERSVALYFADAEGRGLKAEERSIRKGDLEGELSEVIDGLIRGPKGELLPTIPEGTLLLTVEVKGDVAYINLSRSFVENHSGGSSGEIHTIYSLVNTIVLNFPRIKEVQFLIEGRRRKTLAGHVEIDYPLTLDRTMVKG